MSLPFKSAAGHLYSLCVPITCLRRHTPPRLTPEGAFIFPSSCVCRLRPWLEQGLDTGSACAGRVPRGVARRSDASRRGPTYRTCLCRGPGAAGRTAALSEAGPGRRRRPCLWRAASRRTTRTSSTMCLSTSTGAGWPPVPATRASRCARQARLPRAGHRGEGGGTEGTNSDRGVRDTKPRTPPRRKRREPSPSADCGVTAARARGVFLPRLRGAALCLGALSARARWVCGVGRGCSLTRLAFSWGCVSHFSGPRLYSFAQDAWDSLKGYYYYYMPVTHTRFLDLAVALQSQFQPCWGYEYELLHDARIAEHQLLILVRVQVASEGGYHKCPLNMLRCTFLETESQSCSPDDLPASAESDMIKDGSHQERLHCPNPTILKTYSCECCV